MVASPRDANGAGTRGARNVAGNALSRFVVQLRRKHAGSFRHDSSAWRAYSYGWHPPHLARPTPLWWRLAIAIQIPATRLLLRPTIGMAVFPTGNSGSRISPRRLGSRTMRETITRSAVLNQTSWDCRFRNSLEPTMGKTCFLRSGRGATILAITWTWATTIRPGTLESMGRFRV